MDLRELDKLDCNVNILWTWVFAICCGLIMCCSACSTSKPVVLERTLHDTVHVNNLRLDSFLLISADVLRKSMELRLPR